MALSSSRRCVRSRQCSFGAAIAWTAALALCLATSAAHAQNVKRLDNPYGPNNCDGDAAAKGKDLSDPVDLSLGDFQLTQTDLQIPGRGLDFRFTRTYRSRTGLWSLFRGYATLNEHLDGFSPSIIPPSAVGTNWDHSYNIWVSHLGQDTSGTPNTVIELFQGNGTCYELAQYGTEQNGDVLLFERYEFHAILKYGDQDGAGGSDYGPESVEYLTADHTTYRFVDLNDAKTEIQGKIRTITDRNGNQLQFFYDSDDPMVQNPLGRLVKVTDTLGRDIDFLYEDGSYPHLLTKIVDFTGREVEYTYNSYTIDRTHDPAPPATPKTDYEKHNLTHVQLPEIKAQAGVFDLPVEHTTKDGTTALDRREWIFEYEAELDLQDPNAPSWWEDVWVAGGLVTVTDPNGNEIIHNEYLPPLQDLDDIRDYRLIAQEYGGERYDYLVEVHHNMTSDGWHGHNGFDLWVSNRAGHIKKLEYSANRRLERRVDFAGPPAAGQGPALEAGYYAGTLPLPSEPVRPGEDDTQWVRAFESYNSDWHVTEKELPNETVIQYTFDDGINGGVSDFRLRGNLLTSITTPASGNGPAITESWTYLEDFGGCCGSSFPASYTDGEGRETTYDYDNNGNRTMVHYPAITEAGQPDQDIVEEWEYNSHGQVIVHYHPAEYDGQSFGTSNGTNRQEDHFTYYNGSEQDKGYMEGYLKERIVDYGGLNLTTTYEYDHVGNVVKIIEPHGDEQNPTIKVTLYLYNQHNELVRKTVLFDQRQELVDEEDEYGYATDYFYDQNGNRVREDRQNRTENPSGSGIWTDDSTNPVITTVREYDELNFLTATYVEAATVDVALSAREGSSLDLAKFLVTRYQYDANKNLQVIIKGQAAAGLQDDNTVVREYDERDLLYRDHFGATFDVDQDGHITVGQDEELVNSALLTIQYDYDGDKNPVRKAANPDQYGDSVREYAFAYDGHDRRVLETDPRDNETEYEYDDAHNLIREARFDGSVTSGTKLEETKYLFDELDRLKETQRWWPEPANNVKYAVATRRRYYPNSSIKRTEYVRHVPNSPGQSPPWNPFTFQFNGSDYVYDSASRLEKVTDELGNETVYTYDAASNVLTSTEREWSDTLARIEQTFTTTYGYDDLDRLGSMTDSEGNTTSYNYDSRDNQIGVTDARGNETAYSYDPADRLVATVRDMDGDGADEADSDDIVTRQAWDYSSRLIGQQDDARDENGDHAGNWTSYAYDGADRKVATRMADGSIEQVGTGLSAGVWTTPPLAPDLSGFTSGFNALGDPETREDANGTVVDSTYDDKGRLTDREVTPAANNPHNVMGTTAEHYEYDELDRVVLARDDDSAILRVYDTLSRVVSETYYADPDGNIDDPIATLQTLNAGTEATFNYYYNRAQQLYLVEYPADASDPQPVPSRSIRRAYDSLNRVTTIYDDGDDPSAGEFIVTYDYIGRSRVEARSYGNDTVMTYGYDGRTSVNDGMGEFIGAPNDQDDFGAGRIARITHTFLDSTGQPPVPVDFDDRRFLWDANQNKISRVDVRPVTETNRRRYDYAYDAANRLESSTHYLPEATPPSPQVIYDLDGVHNRTSVSDADVADNAGVYYLLGDDASVNQYTLTTRNAQMYDLNGNLTRIQPLCDADLDLNGTVDIFDFTIFSSHFGQCDAGFTWQDGDLDGNGCVDVFDFSTLSSAFGQVCYPDEIAYDFRNQMVRYVDNVGGPDQLTHEYRYDCFGRRLGKKLDTANSTAEQRFYYGGESFWQLCELRTYPDAGTDPEDFTLDGTFVHGSQYIDEVVQYVPGTPEVNDPTAVYYHQDDLFNVMALTDEKGTVIERFEYADYGAPLNQDLSQLVGSYPTVPFLFNGRFYDFEIHGNDVGEFGWYQYRTRLMDPGTGRFVTRDAQGYVDGMNLLEFSRSAPTTLVDPMGQAAYVGMGRCDEWRKKCGSRGCEKQRIPDRFKDNPFVEKSCGKFHYPVGCAKTAQDCFCWETDRIKRRYPENSGEVFDCAAAAIDMARSIYPTDSWKQNLMRHCLYSCCLHKIPGLDPNAPSEILDAHECCAIHADLPGATPPDYRDDQRGNGWGMGCAATGATCEGCCQTKVERYARTKRPQPTAR